MAAEHSPISKAHAEHYTWGRGCDGWHLVKEDQLSIIEERMPPGTSETMHQHKQARQFFYVLAGSAVMQHGNTVTHLETGTGLEIAPGVLHRIFNESHTDLEIIVTSQPPAHGDRLEVVK